MLTRGLGDILAQVVFPAYARIAAEGRRLTAAFDEVWCVLLLLLLPICAFMVVFPGQIVRLLLGDKWTPAAAAFAVLAGGETAPALSAARGGLILAAGGAGRLPPLQL